MDLVALFNNEGVVNLENGCHEDAMVLFTGAIKALYHEISPTDPSKQLQDVSIKMAESIIRRNHLQVLKNLSSTRNKTSNNEQSSFIYNQPLMIDPRMRLRIDNDQDFIHAKKMSAIILYNKALAHHLSTSSSPSSRQKALRLYEMSYDIITSLDEQLTLSTHHLGMALLNNTAEIYHENAEYQDAQQILVELSRCAETVLYSIMGPPQSRQDSQTFFLNAMAYQRSNSAPAA